MNPWEMNWNSAAEQPTPAAPWEMDWSKPKKNARQQIEEMLAAKPQKGLIKTDPQTGQAYIEGIHFGPKFANDEEKAKYTEQGFLKGVIGGALTDTANTLATPINVLARAGNETMRALASLPLEAVDAIAGTDTATDMRRSLPEIRTPSSGQELAATIMQYASPSAQAISKVAQAQKARATLPEAVSKLKQAANASRQYAERIGAAALADMAVTNPDQAATIGDTLGGPTDIEADDTGLTKRIKVGTENLVMAPAVDAALAVGRGAKSALGYTWDNILTDNAMRQRIGQALLDSSLDSDAAIREIEAALRSPVADGRFVPTAGTASGDEGLIALEKGVASDPRMVARANANRAEIAAAREAINAPSGVGTETPGQFFREQNQGMLDAAEQGVKNANERLTQGQRALSNVQDHVAANTGTKEAASAKIDDLYRTTEQAATREKNAAFAAIDPQNAVMRSAQPLQDAADRVLAETTGDLSPLDATTADFIRRIRGLRGPTGGVSPILDAAGNPIVNPERLGGAVSFGEMQKLRPDLSAAISKAKADNDGLLLQRLTILKDAVENETARLAAEGGEAGVRAKTAMDQYRNVYAPNFVQGEGGALRADIRSGKSVPPTATAERFISAAPGSREAAEDLGRILSMSPNPAEGNAAARQYILGKLSDTVVSGKISADRLKLFLNRYGPALESFPQVKAEIDALQKAVRAGEKNVTRLGQEAISAVDAAKMTERELNRSATRFFIAEDPVKAAGRILESSNPPEAMKEVLAAARKDPSGKSVQGLKDAIKEWSNLRMANLGNVTTGGDAAASFAKMNGLFENSATRKALEQVYTPAEIATLDKLRQQMAMMNRINMQVTAGSSTKPLMDAQKQADTVLSSLMGIAGGGRVNAAIRAIMAVIGKDPTKVANRLLVDAMLDPELAKTMMMQAKGESLKVIEKRLGTYVTNNILGELTQDENARPPADARGPTIDIPATGMGGASSTPGVQPERSILPSPQSNAAPLLERIAQAESGGDPNAKNPNSTASGPLQFTDDTWTRAVAKWGKEHGITLKDKNKPEAQMVMGELLRADNARILGKRLGRQPSDGELYVAHFLGADDAAKLIAAQGTGKDAILLFPRRVINSNRSIFFDRKKPRTVEEVFTLLTSKV